MIGFLLIISFIISQHRGRKKKTHKSAGIKRNLFILSRNLHWQSLLKNRKHLIASAHERISGTQDLKEEKRENTKANLGYLLRNPLTHGPISLKIMCALIEKYFKEKIKRTRK